MAAWAMGRVNSFISGKGGARKADADILRKKSKKNDRNYRRDARHHRKSKKVSVILPCGTPDVNNIRQKCQKVL